MRYKYFRIICGASMLVLSAATARCLLVPLAIFSMPLKFSIPLILGLFAGWVIFLMAGIRVFRKPSSAANLLIFAAVIQMLASGLGFFLNRNLEMLDLFLPQVGFFVILAVFFKRLEKVAARTASA